MLFIHEMFLVCKLETLQGGKSHYDYDYCYNLHFIYLMWYLIYSWKSHPFCQDWKFFIPLPTPHSLCPAERGRTLWSLRRWHSKLNFFYKIVNGLLQDYLHSNLDFSSEENYPLRSAASFSPSSSRTKSFKNTFFLQFMTQSV